MRWRSRLAWLLVPMAGTCLAWATTSVLALFTDAAPVGANAFSTAADWDCVSPGTSTLTASADTWIDEGASSQNKGSDPTLSVRSATLGGNRRALVRFSLPELPGGCAVTAANLRIHNGSPSNGRTIDVYRSAAPWVENTATWNTRPGTTGTAASGTVGGTGYQQWTVTSAVQTQYVTNNGFVVRDRSEGALLAAAQGYASRESANPPQLVLSWG